LTDAHDPQGRQQRVGVTGVRLVCRGRELLLPPAAYTLGRSPSCEIVIHDSLASRRHARIVVDAHGAQIEDLNSINGVYVNDERIAAPRRLQDGDHILIGREELVVGYGTATEVQPNRPTQPGQPAVERAVPPISPIEPEDPVTDTHTRSEGLALMEIVAERMLGAGRLREAEDLLRVHLDRVRDGVGAGRIPSEDTRDAALRCAARLAAATHRTQWLSYVLDILTALRMPCPESVGELVREAGAQVEGVDALRLRAYRAVLHELPSSFDKVRTLELIDRLERLGARS
jgi:hypothetical protein